MYEQTIFTFYNSNTLIAQVI